MIKRIVVLQDESLVVQELARGPRQSLAAQAAQATAAAPQAEPVQPAVPVATMPVPPQMPIAYGGQVGVHHAASLGGNGLAGPSRRQLRRRGSRRASAACGF